MTQLCFARETKPGSVQFTPVGLINWFAIHPTNFGKQRTRIGGDNKDWAAMRVKDRKGRGLVSGFANAAADDASGNFVAGAQGFEPVDRRKFADQRDRTITMGEAQSKLPLDFLGRSGTESIGPVQALEFQLDVPARTGAPGELGMSMSAGRRENRGHVLLPECIALTDPRNPTTTTAGSLIAGALGQPLTLAVAVLLNSVSAIVAAAPLSAVLNSPQLPPFFSANLVGGQFATLAILAQVTTIAGARFGRAAQALHFILRTALRHSSTVAAA